MTADGWVGGSPAIVGLAATAKTTSAPAISLRGVGHAWGELTALDDIDMLVAPASFVALVGASGCGKSTLLRLMAGMERPTSGTIDIDGAGPDRWRREKMVGWMAQQPALLPWLSVRDNVTLAQRVKPRDDRDLPRVVDLLEMVSLSDFGDALPAQLSGGMQQRAALARTLAVGAPMWLMDEPFAALDELTREVLAADLLAIWQRVKPTVVWVTHHLSEAVALADRVVLLPARPGPIAADIIVDLPRPRDATSPDFQDVVRRARTALWSVGHMATSESTAPGAAAGQRVGPGREARA